MTILAVVLLAAAVVVRALVALVEALSVLLLVAILATLTLPRGFRWYWRRLRRALPQLLRQWSDWLEKREPEA